MGYREAQAGFSLPFTYSLFFLFIEPLGALAGAYFTHVHQPYYLSLLSAPSASSADVQLSTPMSVAMSQLASMYLFFALNEALILRATSDIQVWRAVLLVLLVADFAHLYALKALGPQVYYDVWNWSAGDWGNVPFVYLGALMRICFLRGVGLGAWKTLEKKKKK
ncbi:NADP-dependent alcohol dehydrogenase-like protein [Emericellopsis cladophorae]|uniref:NADP-dependent alcohol dehydrogenase-like protein n=1 Tax=Emericellopsis cladophorae TaxID=2686198 RepID=A0A9Q0BBU5_9HYPO|nr:NADP-dependent alcohol dehydrogenase-like protein [Emericellopsis cladophorae]KAI6778880.1 NADP-dependent alcohol dehydrogenase-like protein [Emericellopsis cladophorae]